ncbi:zinc finger-domain protein, putative [Trypanosoma brucei gambiense DAL972]|uniref:Zinc finger-domain protein, putative n=1 Tax=Trypanosoma brucei gambiense (strain MHOM/CI/86/DAL972) TaxID=679716 RepID=C9ZRG8_TRYB9|nr:zinc finger-domain protein, putative [Trypanosoma brucei gambiense DAL972]CBH11998.1 zinc finger-domain protein, putative [Trypanosoma brucei gambiense DAL972]|eukprot:XP_011774283.1 zinc finger-domain protein, putative [Trypanosoma brucei gambiense DAL972]
MRLVADLTLDTTRVIPSHYVFATITALDSTVIHFASLFFLLLLLSFCSLAIAMSFTANSGNSPMSQMSPLSQPYTSPQMLPQSSLRPTAPPFTLSGTEDQPATGAPIRKGGTDPTRYKTTICRNWEMGSCSFKGCTFAHGEEELRMPPRVERYKSSGFDTRRSLTAETPPLYPLNPLPHSGVGRIEHLLNMLYSEVLRERNRFVAHEEANQALEALLKKEQMQREETEVQLEAARWKLEQLRTTVHEASVEINTLLASSPANEGLRDRVAMVTQKIASVFSSEDTAVGGGREDEERVMKLLSSLQNCQSTEDM